MVGNWHAAVVEERFLRFQGAAKGLIKNGVCRGAVFASTHGDAGSVIGRQAGNGLTVHPPAC